MPADEEERRTDHDGAPARPEPGPEETLRRRYAAGQIDRETYLQMQRDLSGG